MPSSSRFGTFVLAVVAALASAACSSTTTSPQSCQSAAECSANARCTSTKCVANAPPVAQVAVPPGALEANVILTFDGSSSADPDSAVGDSIVSHAWDFRAIAAQCAPPVVAGTGPAAAVRFACAGTYAVDLTVVDELGAPGVATKEFEIGEYSGPALLVLGPDVALEHACTTGPVRCAPAGSVALSASTTPSAPPDLAFLWTVETPPGRSLDEHRRVAFSPGPDAPAPTVTIETDGQAISGDWIFRLEARDAAGVVASGAIRVSVGNRQPVLAKAIPVPDHAFDGAQFTASGEVPFTVTDPDGDEIVGRTVEWRHVGDGPNGLFTGTVLDSPGRVTFSVVVPYASPEDAQRFMGGAALERSILFSIADVNGPPVVDVWPIVIGNRPPVLVSQPPGIGVQHTYDPVALAYEAVAPLSTWSDPDGDPLMPVPGSSTGDPQCAQLDVVNGVAVVSCSLAFAGTPAVANFAGAHVIAQHVQDPWAEAAPSPATFTIGNRPPSIASTTSLHVACSLGDCCRTMRDPETGMIDCVAWDSTWEPETTLIAGLWNDEDGDPLHVTVTGASSQVCTPSTCAFPFQFDGYSVCGGPLASPPDEVRATTAGDGADTASGSITATVSCG